MLSKSKEHEYKRSGKVMVGVLLIAAAAVMIPIEACKGNGLLTMSSICFDIAGIGFLLENRKKRKK